MGTIGGRGGDIRKNDVEDKFPERLRQLRERRRISRRVLSELCGLSKNMIAVYERGEVDPTVSAVMRLADYFDVSSDYLFCRK